MNARAWRLVKRRHVATAFSGDGAKKFGGRWNLPGTAVVYTAGSISLAVLETLVHLESSDLLAAFVVVPVEVASADIEDLDRASLPRDWRSFPPSEPTQRIGDDWCQSGRTVALRVPSVIVPEEYNYVLNPRHEGFARLSIGKPSKFSIDPRLARRPVTA